jgi:hypothetical protein
MSAIAKPKTIRMLGIACMLGGIFFSANGIWEVLQPSLTVTGEPQDLFHFRALWLVFGLLCAPAFFAGQLGYYLTRAAGRHWFSRTIIVLAALGATMYVLNSLSLALTLRRIPLMGMGLPLHQWISTLLLGIAALGARRVTVWKRLWPVWTGIAPAILFPLYLSVFGWPAFAALATSGVNWTIFGYAVYTEGKASAAQAG